jgi:uncharacterized protein (TIGR02117 family)
MEVGRYFFRLVAFACLLPVVLVASCTPLPPAAAGDSVPRHIKGPSTTIFVASNGWHSAIFVLRRDIAPGDLPETKDFPNALYLGFGWGDADYFPARDPGIATLISAALWPTPAVLHVTGLRISPRDVYGEDKVEALKISSEGVHELVAFLADSFVRHGRKRSKPIGPGLDANSHFYSAKGEFHLFNTCNSWTARGLVAAGVPIDADSVVRAEDLMVQLKSVSNPKK